MSREAVLVDADWVEAHLSDPNIVLVEVDEDVSAYDKGHISGAVRVDWKADLQDPVRRDFVDKAGFEKLVHGPVTLQVGTATVDASLNVGSTTQEVVVSSDVQAMHTENPEVANTFNTQALASLPNVTPSWQNFVKMLPGGGDALKQMDIGKQEKEFKRMEGMVCAMTMKERRNPVILNASRRRRIAAGSGVTVTELNTTLNKFFQMQTMMKKMGKMSKMMAKMGGAMPGMMRR